MKISLLDNGLDSLQKGFAHLKIYEREYHFKESNKERFYILKDTILAIHHGIEILMKYILFKESEFLIFSDINKAVKNAFHAKRNNNYDSIFETDLGDKIHTVSFAESIERIQKICGYILKDNFGQKLNQLQNYRNQLIHAEIKFNENEINKLFDGFVDDIDSFLMEAIGDEYKTLTGYGELVKNNEEYIEYLDANNRKKQKEILEFFIEIFEELEIGMGLNEVKIITDINLVTRIFDKINEKGFMLGTDLYNGFCSGDIKIKRIDNEHFSIYAFDNNAEYIFKFKSFLIYLPPLDQGISPSFYFESEEDSQLPEKASENEIETDDFNMKYLFGLCFEKDKDIIYGYREVNKFYARLEYDEFFIAPAYHEVFRYMSEKIFCFINFQSLPYNHIKFKKIEKFSLKQVELLLREELEKD